MSEGFFLCGGGPSQAAGLSVQLYLCPWCQGTGRWGDQGETCHSCSGSGQTSDPAPGVDLTRDYPADNSDELPSAPPQPIERPPAVMAAPCTDCAFRPGSPEGLGEQAPADSPFYCHHGLTRIGDGYIAPAYLNGLPLGAYVCAGWWAARIEDKPLPRVAFRDPGGNDRSSAAPRDTPPARPTSEGPR